MKLLAGSLAGLGVACGLAAAAPPPRSVLAPAPVTALAVDGPRVAYASGRTTADCERVRIWNRSTRSITRLGRRTSCEVTSTGTSIAAVAIAGTRALWLHYTGGNIREWTLWTATTSRPRARTLAFLTRDVEAPPPIVVGDGDDSRLGDMLPYAVGRSVIVLRANGARRFSWTAPARVVALSALGGELAVAYEGGLVAVLDAAGRQLRTERYSGEITAVKITGAALIVQHGRALDVRGGGRAQSFLLVPGARLADAQGNLAVITRGREVIALRLDDGHGDVVERAAGRALGQIEPGGLVVAGGRRITFVPLAELARRSR